MVRTVSRQAAALTKARERRRALDAARDEQDGRVEEATAEALVALEARREAEQGLQAATATLAETLRASLAEDVSAERAAALLEMDTADVRRLTKMTERPAAVEDSQTATVSHGAIRSGVSEVENWDEPVVMNPRPVSRCAEGALLRRPAAARSARRRVDPRRSRPAGRRALGRPHPGLGAGRARTAGAVRAAAGSRPRR